jgi:hypothetical protein
MKNVIATCGSIILVLATLSISGCTNGNYQNFETDEITFAYPEKWVNSSNFWASHFGFNYIYAQDPDLDAQELAFVLDPDSATKNEKYTTWLKVEKKVKTSDSSLEQVFNETYGNQFTSYKKISNQSTRLGMNTTAYEIVYQKYHGNLLYQVRDVWQEKKGSIYIISCWTLPSNYQKVNGYFQTVINTLHIK